MDERPQTSRRDYMGARRRRRRRRLVVLAVACCAVVAVAATIIALQVPEASGTTSSTQTSFATETTRAETTTTEPTPSSMVSAAPSTTAPPSTTTTVFLHPIAQPVRIVIPAIRVDSTIIEVGIMENGSMEVPPFGLAGWYKLGPAPGAAGPAVIVAHVDSTDGPDVFYRLKDLDAGDEVLVYGEDGQLATFVMDSKEQQLKTELPTERIWNDTWEPVIRLITCGGDFDRSSRHYLSNVIVYGHLKN